MRAGTRAAARVLSPRPERDTQPHAIARVRHFLASEDGPTAVEYAVMLALIIVVCIAAVTVLGQNANQQFDTVSSTIESTAS
mgnify:CR=1 FL=1